MSELANNHESATLLHLRELEKSGEYLFHGSQETIDTLEPRQAYSHGVADGEPAVCAASDLDTAIFMALNSSARNILRSRGEGCRSGYNHNGDDFYFYASPNMVAVFREGLVSGNIHVLGREEFMPYHGQREMRSATAVKPIETVLVTVADFSHEVHEMDIEQTTDW